MKKNLNNKRFSLKIHSVTSFLILLITFTLTIPALAQIPDLSSKELKQLKEAEELKTEAEELQLKANELYLEASVLQQDEEYDISKKLQKESEKLEKEALKSEEKAAELFEKSTEIKKEIYEEAIEQFWKDFDGNQSDYTNAKLIEETAEEYFFRAEEIRRDAAKMKDEQEAILKQNEAYELELMALEKLTNAYDIYKYGPSGVVTYPDEPVTYEEPEVDTTTTAMNPEKPLTAAQTTTPEEHIMETGEQVEPDQGEVNVDQQQLDMILGSIRRSEMAGDTAEFYPRNLFSSFDTESLRKSMEQYQSMEMPETEPSLTEEPQVSEVYEEPVMEEPISEPEEVIAEDVQEETIKEIVQPYEPVEIGRVEERVVPDPDSEIIYKVQIAADRAPLSQNVLKKLYYGDREMERINEDGWYKYSIGDFETFEEADQYRKSLGVKDAFVVAYRGSKRLRDYQQQAMDEPVAETLIEPETPVTPVAEVSPAANQLSYVVQIAASKTPMEESHLSKIYSGNKQINTRREDGWYKYQIGQTPVYEEARETLRNAKVNGAFIAAYRNNERIGFGRITNENVSSDEPLFMLQIAASKKPLSSKQIEKIYQGNSNVREVEEDGWYKYQIPAGTTYNDARRLKNLLKINGAFTVAYLNNEKIDIRKAIEMTK